jgi:hypothetical protein
MPVYTARRGRFPRAASIRAPAPVIPEVHDSSSELSDVDEDEEVGLNDEVVRRKGLL